ncbi:MAG: PKD domain-containing protein [Candidatus Gracilibacteria bacterium]|jgi:hypothetical protein
MKLRNLTIIGLLTLLLPSEATFAAYNSMLAPTNFTPANYIQPSYDPFSASNTYAPTLPEDQPDTAPVAAFNIYNGGFFQNNNVGTTDTAFTFDGSSSYDSETDSSRLEVRWDFENDGVIDGYFSVIKSIKHTFKKPGVYQVKMEVLDRAGNVSKATKTVTVVANTDPIPAFSYTPISDTNNTIFQFDTHVSRSDQFVASTLQYRFDWNGDSKWDTKYQAKTIWNHLFDSAGSHNVIMEVKDPGGHTAKVNRAISTFENTPPVASFGVFTGTFSSYEFNAKATTDAETAHYRLFYRWDFEYSGTNDIMYNTYAGNTDRVSYNYKTPGHKIVRLEVMDAYGAKSYAYAEFDVPWTKVMAQNLIAPLK